jgi:glycosyltransferase involved in cell wall biosynthesis
VPTAIYLYDIDGWALHALGRWLADSAVVPGELRLMRADAWHASPVAADVLYLSYSGLLEPGVDYRRWAGRVVTTIHDPCEVSFFEHRADWARLPLHRPLLDKVDACSVISEELRDLLRARGILEAPLTPTWSPRSERLRAARRPRDGDVVRVMSSTNVPLRRPVSEIMRRLRHPALFLRDENGRLSLRQLSALPVRRRRKRTEWLAEIMDAPIPGLDCDFRAGAKVTRSADEYEAALGACDVYVCTSTMEGGPLPVLEAVMAGAAVLSTRVGQVPSWIEDGGSGFFCDTPADFVARLRAYATDHSLLRRHQARAREIADGLAPDLARWRELLTAP